MDNSVQFWNQGCWKVGGLVLYLETYEKGKKN